jgi:riboflavin synthase
MFTGLVECSGRVVRRASRGPSERLVLASPLIGLVLGESVAVNGACLTVVEDHGGTFEADVSAETLEKTTLGELAPGAEVNLERSLKVGDRLGGHLVAGHVDGVARLVDVTASGDARRLSFEAPALLAPFIAPKGSVALQGVSLTVNDVSGRRFGVMLIPHTLAVTNLKELRPGSRVNLEIDLVARYVVRYLTATRELPAADPDASLRAALERAELI